ncbi:thiamine phosphate synthase [Sphingobium algorifonticola]|uniref:Thiamine phosphate synthase n=2 Tax=Sphingobium algorifonticola TaxID=2008318 RepID=A0A437JEE4_9SPHN|nr:thiamine phosphate synthase [Sphingobium algorifonticola]RVT44040.1 thiamine phosphate synthase [Sphingobium algorifonticola]
MRHCKKLGPAALPTLWLMTDPRIAESALIRALYRLPRGAGVIFRHQGWPPDRRRALFDIVRGVTRRRALCLLLAGEARVARAWGADGWHGRHGAAPGVRRGLLHSAPVHDVPQIRSAERSGAQLLLLSPIFPTRSHPGAPVLGRVRFAMLLRRARRPVIALGGMTARRWRSLRAVGATGWAAIDALAAESHP